MITAKKILLVINECTILLSITIISIVGVIQKGPGVLMQDYFLVLEGCYLLCLLLPLALKKPGFPLSKVMAGISAFLASLLWLPMMFGAAVSVFVFTGGTFEAIDRMTEWLFGNQNGIWMLLIILFVFLYLFDFSISFAAALEWVEEKRQDLPQKELKKLESIYNLAGKIFAGMIMACGIVMLILFLNQIIHDSRERGVVDVGIELAAGLIAGILSALPYLLVLFLFSWFRNLLNRPDPKTERRKEALSTVESCLDKETIQGDMEALTILERSQSDIHKKEIHSRASFYVFISLVRYRLGDFDGSEDSIREALSLYEKIVEQEGGDTDATLYLKTVLYDVRGRISGTLRDYGRKLENCRSMLNALKSHPAAYAYRSETGRAYCEMADALCGLGQYEEALATCDKAAAELAQLTSQETAVAKSSNALLNRVRAQVLLASGKIYEAEECASKSTELYSGMAENFDNAIGASHLIMAEIQSELGNTERAEKENLIAESLIRDRYGVNHPIYKMSQTVR